MHAPIVTSLLSFFFFNDTATTEIYTLSLHDALPIPQHNKRDSGSDIAARSPIARNLKTGVHNVSIHPCQISGKNRISILQRRDMCSPMTPSRRIGRAGREWLQSQLAETAPLSGRNCPVSRLIVEARGEHLYGW